MKKGKNLKCAFTLVELLLSLAIGGVMCITLLCVYNGASNYIEKIKLQNVIQEFKTGLNSVIKNPTYYANDSDLANLEEVKIENAVDGSYKSYKATTKFRGVLLRELNVREYDPISCYIMMEDKHYSLDNCYKGDNNVVWGVPETDFVEKNVVFAQNASGSVYKYVPVTIYPDLKHLTEIADLDRYALVYGVRRDGDITVIATVDCSEDQYKSYNQCKYADFISKKQIGR